MSTLNRIHSTLTLPMLSALLITLSGGAMIAQAATVTSTDHYQKQIKPTCSGVDCSGNFPAPGAGHRLNLTRITCLLNGTAGSTFAIGGIILHTANNGDALVEYLPTIFSASNGLQTLNQAIDVQLAANQHIEVDLQLASGAANSGVCTATGTLDTLQ